MTTIALVTRFAVAVLLLVVAVAVLGVDVGDGGNSRHRHSLDSIVVIILSIQGVDGWRTRLGMRRKHLRSLILENERREDHCETEQGDGQDDDDVNRGLGLS